MKSSPATPIPAFEVPTHSVIVPPGRVRIDYGDVQELAESIEEVGQIINPLVVDRDLNLIAGERRLLAAQLLGMDKVPVHVIDAGDPELVELAENGKRKNFTPEEIGEWADKNWDAPWVSRFKGNRRDILGRRVGVSGVQLERCRKLVLAARGNRENKDILDIAAEKGAKAAERELKKRTELDKPEVHVFNLSDDYDDNARKDIFESGISPSVLFLEDTKLSCWKAGFAPIVFVKLNGARSLGQIDVPDYTYCGLDIAIAGDTPFIFARFAYTSGDQSLEDLVSKVHSARTTSGAFKALVCAYASEGETVCQFGMKDISILMACDKRNFCGTYADDKVPTLVAEVFAS